jgi:hypothetical protein
MMISDGKLGRMIEEAVVAIVKLLSKSSLGRTEETYKKTQTSLAPLPKFETVPHEFKFLLNYHDRYSC